MLVRTRWLQARWLQAFFLFSPPILLSVWLAAGTTLAARSGWEGATFEEERFIAAMAAEHDNVPPVPSSVAQRQPRRAVDGERISLADGTAGYVARPRDATGPLPGLLVIHEWWGLDESVEAMTRRLAGEGYVALAVDLYGGFVATDREGAMAAMRSVSESEALEDLRSGWTYLKEREAVAEVGVIGRSFGGGWSLNAAIALGDDIDATLIYYGRLTTDPSRLAEISSPVLGLFGSEDDSIPLSSVRSFEAAMHRLGKAPVIRVYEGVDHSFANPSGERYDADAAEDAWQRATAFLAEHLQ